MHKRSLTLFSTGFSMVEILVSIVLSLFLSTVLIQIFINNRSAYDLGNGFAVLQENARFIEYYISGVGRLAGFRTSPTVLDHFSAFNTVFVPATSPYVNGTQATGPNQSDSLTIRYQGNNDGTIVDCLNAPVASNSMVTNIFSINNNFQLICRSVNTSPGGAADRTDAIIDGVESLQVLFGEDTNGDGSADRYVPANYAQLQLNRIVSIRIGFLLRTTDALNTSINTNTYNILGTTFTAPSDRRLRQSFSFTIHLRNIPLRRV